MSGDYRYLIVDAATGDAITEVPLAGVTFSYVLNGCGQLSATFPADAYFATAGVFEDVLHELTVLRDEIPVWNGPITNLDGSRRGGWNLTAREASWYLQKRTIEDHLVYTSEDIFQIVRDLVAYMIAKTANGADGMTAGADINADLPRFLVASGTAGVTKSYEFFGTHGRLISQALDDVIVGDPSTGLDYAMGYRGGSTRQTCIRTLLLGSPALGTQQELQLRSDDLYDYGKILDWEEACTRETVVGDGYIKRLQNTGAVAAGVVLLEHSDDRGDLTDHDSIDDYCRSERRKRNPPVKDRWVEYVPSVSIPFDQYSLGDNVVYDIDGPGLLALSGASRRLIQTDVTPSAGGDPERVRLTTSRTIDDLGA